MAAFLRENSQAGSFVSTSTSLSQARLKVSTMLTEVQSKKTMRRPFRDFRHLGELTLSSLQLLFVMLVYFLFSVFSLFALSFSVF